MRHTLINCLWVGAGGCVGSIARYLMSVLGQRLSIVWPVGTFASNVAGCFLIGVFSHLALQTEVLSPSTRLLLTAGFCGGFTTMSSMIYETGQMTQSREYLHAVVYLGGTVAVCFLAFFAGMLIARLIWKTGGGPWN